MDILFTWLMCALATGYRLQCEPEEAGGEPAGGQRCRRQLLPHMRDVVILFAQDTYGMFRLAEYSGRVGVNSNERPPGIGTQREILAKYALTSHGCPYIRISRPYT